MGFLEKKGEKGLDFHRGRTCYSEGKEAQQKAPFGHRKCGKNRKGRRGGVHAQNARKREDTPPKKNASTRRNAVHE